MAADRTHFALGFTSSPPKPDGTPPSPISSRTGSTRQARSTNERSTAMSDRYRLDS
jgi:hypothetical protein